jgi:hypothetical protein
MRSGIVCAGSFLGHVLVLAVAAGLLMKPFFLDWRYSAALLFLLILLFALSWTGLKGSRHLVSFVVGGLLAFLVGAALLTVVDWALASSPQDQLSASRFLRYCASMLSMPAALLSATLSVLVPLAATLLGVGIGLIWNRHRPQLPGKA